MTAKFRVVPIAVTAKENETGVIEVTGVGGVGEVTYYSKDQFHAAFSPENAEANDMWKDLYGYALPLITLTVQEPLTGQGSGTGGGGSD